MTTAEHQLSITCHLDASPAAVWRAWTEHTAEWFAPRPWTTPEVDHDLRAGGRMRTVMRSPEGEDMPGEGVFLEVVPKRRIVWSDALGPGWVPQAPFMLAIAELEPEGAGTRYTATVRHWEAQTRQWHEEMGFEKGWMTVARQLEEVARRLEG